MLLPDILPEPYQRPYTLVVDLDGVLVHSKWTVRPRTRTQPFHAHDGAHRGLTGRCETPHAALSVSKGGTPSSAWVPKTFSAD